jgi:hypothetical protein
MPVKFGDNGEQSREDLMDDFDILLHFLRLVYEVAQAVDGRVKELVVW